MLIHLKLICCTFTDELKKRIWYCELIRYSSQISSYKQSEVNLGIKKMKKAKNAFEIENKKLIRSHFEPFKEIFKNQLADILVLQKGIVKIHQAIQQRICSDNRCTHHEFEDKLSKSFDGLKGIENENNIRLEIYSIFDDIFRILIMDEEVQLSRCVLV
ncbi:hypothetical protein TUBRATIS_22060 [Tubulinosema ratisbonensis]|uniref:Uncharacterized protein n=1 Tax=Tubulinosema ratisbonensis TaxID=291195 RepID=A0A437AJK1_9MICR|nr:hypothetical protein TUBRATIS_22060 [Tubulinosema ratisbonensis]